MFPKGVSIQILASIILMSKDTLVNYSVNLKDVSLQDKDLLGE